MKRLFILIFSLIIIYLTSCERFLGGVKCSECTLGEPYEAILKCQIDRDSNIGVLVEVWEGKLEDNILIDSKQVYGSAPVEIHVSLNKHYTVTATYIIDNKTYIAVDSALPKVKYSSNQCDDPCYYIYGNTVELRLKYK
jgi:hypothetical protein